MLVGCASRQAVTYEQLAMIQVNDRDCKNIDGITKAVEQQLQAKRILGRNPEDLSEADREYNSRARVIIWSLRIGCNNPRWSLQ
jgi:hypothetical protein